MTRSLRSQRLLARATFGPRPGDREELDRQGAGAWLERELTPREDPELERRLRAFDARSFDPVDFLAGRELPRRDQNDRAARRMRRELRDRVKETAREMAGIRLVRAVHGQRGLAEVMVDFWANHFNVFARKGLVGGLVPGYQRDVIERHALGRFEDLLIGVAESPAMLVYLDNWLSVVPQGRARSLPRFRRRPGGINENYARELLELHTLGVHGGYTQEDVEQVARVLSGWTLEGRRRPVFRFRPVLHDPARKRVLGQAVPGEGREEGLWLLRRLARHPATARFVSGKLVRRFVSDVPPQALVERAAQTFLEHDGRIDAVVRTILLSPELVDPQHRKLRTPLRLLSAALRATGGETDGRGPALLALARLGELPFFCRAPTGYPEAQARWVDPGAMLARMGLAFALAHGRLRHTALGAERSLIGGRSDREATALALAAPEFQWA